MDQEDSFLLDRIVDAAAGQGIYIEMCFITRDLYMKRLKDPKSAEYTEYIAHAKRLARYCVARWGWSKNVAIWEYFNEMNPGLPTDRFYRELGEYIEKIDPNRHLRAVSDWSPNPRSWKHPKLDQADEHYYMRPANKELFKDAALAVAKRAAHMREHAPKKPALMAEFGLADDKFRKSDHMKQNREHVHLHNAMWAGLVTGLSGTPMHWWWEDIDKHDVYPIFKPFAAFVADLPITTGGLEPARPKVAGAARAWALVGRGRAYVWCQDPNATWHKLIVEKHEPREIRGASIELKGLGDGQYRAQWWDTRAGKVVKEQKISVTGILNLSVPPFTRDIACKVVP
jgi:hypothetical protein